MVTRPILLKSKIEEEIHLIGFKSIGLDSSSENIWKLYNAFTKAKPEDFFNSNNRHSEENKTHLIDYKKLNDSAYCLAAIIFYNVMNNKCDLNVLSMNWEYCMGSNDLYNIKLKELLANSGSLEKIPKIVYDAHRKDITGFRTNFNYLHHTIISITLDNGTKDGLYFKIPFYAFNSLFLDEYLRHCTISTSRKPIKTKFQDSYDLFKFSYTKLKSEVSRESFGSSLCIFWF